MECAICYGNEDSHCINCKSCNSNVCRDCMREYINHSLKDLNITPFCPNCKNEYLYDSFLPGRTRSLYVTFLWNYIKRNDSITFKKNVSTDDVIAQIRLEKLKFLDEMPPCIKLMTELVFKKEYNDVVNLNMQIVEQRVAKLEQELNSEDDKKRRCLSGICSTGRLSTTQSGDYSCDSCFSKFCSKCEKKMYSNHVCSEQDLKSMAEISKLPKCPNCNVHVEKISGCNYMTCAYCKTNFDYISGKISDYGNHQTYRVNYNTTYNLTRELKGKYSKQILDIIKNFEDSKETVSYNDLQPFFEIENPTDRNRVEMFKVYTKIKQMMSRIKVHSEKLLQIRKLHIDEQLTIETLREILEN